MFAMNSRIDAAVAKLEAKGVSPDRRRSSLLSRQSTLTRAVSGVNPNPRPAEATAAAGGPKLQRLYTIDQDAFFPDLPQLVQVGHLSLIHLPAPKVVTNSDMSWMCW